MARLRLVKMLPFGLLVALPCAPAPGQQPMAVQVRWADGQPAANVTIRLYPVGSGAAGELLARWRTTDGDGIARFEGMQAGDHLCDSDRGGRCRVEVGNGHVGELTIPDAVEVRGSVIDATGAPVPGAMLWLSAFSKTEQEGGYVGAAATDGTFVLRDVEPGRLLRAVAPGWQASRAIAVDRRMADVALRLDLAGRTVRGVVRDRAGQPVREAVLQVEHAQGVPAHDRTLHEVLDRRPPPLAITDAGGNYVLHGLPAHEAKVWIGSSAHAVHCLSLAAWTTTADVELGPACSVRGTVRDENGAPVPKVTVSADSLANLARHGTGFLDMEPQKFTKPWLRGTDVVVVNARSPQWASGATCTDATGAFRIDRLPAARGVVRCRRGMASARRILDFAAGPRCDLKIETGDPIHGELTGGRAAVNWLVFAIPTVPGHDDWLVTNVDNKRRFVVNGCADIPYDLFLLPRSTRRVTLPADATPIRLGARTGDSEMSLAIEEPATAELSVKLLKQNGDAVYDGMLVLERRHQGLSECHVHRAGADGRLGAQEIRPALVGPVVPGIWKITARWREHSIVVGERELRPGGFVDLGVLKF